MTSSSKKSRELFNRAQIKIPGAVNSPVRAWSAVGGAPLFIARGEGAFIFDADGNRLLDYVGSYGPAVLGHANHEVVAALAKQAQFGLGFGAPTELEVELAETLSSAIKCAEKVRLVSSGTEAGMTALRIARAATRRRRIIKFDGCYHGHSDALLVRAGSGGMTLGVPDSAGVPAELAELTLVARYNDIGTVKDIVKKYPGEVAAIIVEPIAANMGVVAPARGFLAELAGLARREGALLICDEVITGFRMRLGAVTEAMGIEPDLLMLGKIIGGGMPVGAVAGPAVYMDMLAPVGPVYQAGTLSGNPLAVRAGLETLKILKRPGTYERLEAAGARLESGLRDALRWSEEPGCVNRAGSILTMFLGPEQVRDADEARCSDKDRFARFFHAMIEHGVNVPPSQYEAMFISLAHGDAEIDRTIETARAALASLRN
ncbi:MAG TPA: glutamate-1-semialdehyde 2,1-aminomutase [Candidatus Binataceae bacterium]